MLESSVSKMTAKAAQEQDRTGEVEEERISKEELE
jgi:hypothetical protein